MTYDDRTVLQLQLYHTNGDWLYCSKRQRVCSTSTFLIDIGISYMHVTRAAHWRFLSKQTVLSQKEKE